MNAAPATFPSTFQFERTRAIRYAVYREASLSLRRRVLDVGGGENLVAEEIALRTGRPAYAVDLTPGRPVPASVRCAAGDAMALPFADGTFDAVAFHFVLLWVREPLRALREAKRVLRAGGVVMVLAEPDLLSRRDDPDTGLGRAVVRAVERGGGHPDAGRRAEEWLRSEGFRPSIRMTTARWAALQNPEEAEHELAFFESSAGLSPEEISTMAAAEKGAVEAGERRVLLPLAYGCGWKD